MTDLVQTQIPDAINTVEGLASWNLALLYDLFGGRMYQEVQGDDLTALVTAQGGRAGDGTERLIYRVSLQLHPDWRTSPNPIWMDTIEYAEVAIPTRYIG